ncbi:hypothetical protein PTTG_28293 [Puccinia triticina 1-1 BBBD Race 1]|uniref:Uncharacterized protein n=1 Tax=Puccinia triticina (isolate 1-1 / race 1 (BBBD)) TaxID=630390 RepID=A0A180GCZ0_PUCT1|nr:hypothetical protein PTTG_28293 [Puccinia triticina 1-1 BBBD Race 1]
MEQVERTATDMPRVPFKVPTRAPSSSSSISQSKSSSRSSSATPMSPKSLAKKFFKSQAVRDSRIKLIQKILDMGEDSLRDYIIKDSESFFGQTPTALQTRIAEMYHHLFAPSTRKATILVLNPLDSLGENQVAEKEKDGMTAISLTKMTFTRKVADKIIKGDYSFVYLDVVYSQTEAMEICDLYLALSPSTSCSNALIVQRDAVVRKFRSLTNGNLWSSGAPTISYMPANCNQKHYEEFEDH